MNHRGKSSVKLMLSVGISLLFIAYIYVNRESLVSIFRDINPKYIGIILFCQAGLQLSNAAIFKTSIGSLKGEIGLFEAFRVTIVSSFVNFFTPMVGGASTKAVYVRHHHNISYSSFAATMYANYMVAFLVSFICGFFGVLMTENALSSISGKLAIIFFGFGSISTLVFMVYGHSISNKLGAKHIKNRLPLVVRRKAVVAYTGWMEIRKHNNALVLMCMSATCAIGFTIASYSLCMSSLGIQANTGSAMIFAALASISLLFNITPGNLGVRETIYASVFAITAVSADQVVAFSLLERTLLILLTGSGWLLFGHGVLDKKSDEASS